MKAVPRTAFFCSCCLHGQHGRLNLNPYQPIIMTINNSISCFHQLVTDVPKPARFTFPFCYEPHPLCVLAAGEVQRYIAGMEKWHDELQRGKMFGVLVAEDEEGHLGFTAAFSGLLDGSNDHPYFVPPVFDATPADGYFKVNEAKISAINRAIDGIENGEGYLNALHELESRKAETAAEEEQYRLKIKEAKAARDARRQSGTPITPEEEEQMLNESRFMKAELHRMKKRNREQVDGCEARLKPFEDEIRRLKDKRKAMSDSLQHWLFEQYGMLNARGERRGLCSIFADTPQHVPPSGAGDCCAPKLLQHAYLNRLHPVCMAEFWWGDSPKSEIRHHLHYYPACRGKCLPILTHMLQGLDVDPDPRQAPERRLPEIVYEDEWLIVACKPAGMLSVQGKSDRQSAASLIGRSYDEGSEPVPVHRLDMDTSGLIILAKTPEAYKNLQEQFCRRSISKRYVALLEGTPKAPESGRISLPLIADPLNRPYQKVDFDNGKTAVTDYKIIGQAAGRTLIELFPHTGRTHQLRVHCAHKAGLGTPILGDSLYGHPADRLYLHAEAITFRHPATGREMTFERTAGFRQAITPQD